jgi:ubiquinone biosynthesis protein UbiJ
MAVGKVGGGGRKGGAGGAKGAGPAGKAGGGFAGKVERAESLVGPSGAAGPGSAQALDPVTAQAADIARQLRSGQIKSKEEATKRLVAEVLKEKVRMQSKALTQRIADSLQEDPHLNQALERLWSKAE